MRRCMMTCWSSGLQDGFGMFESLGFDGENVVECREMS